MVTLLTSQWSLAAQDSNLDRLSVLGGGGGCWYIFIFLSFFFFFFFLFFGFLAMTSFPACLGQVSNHGDLQQTLGLFLERLLSNSGLERELYRYSVLPKPHKSPSALPWPASTVCVPCVRLVFSSC